MKVWYVKGLAGCLGVLKKKKKKGKLSVSVFRVNIMVMFTSLRQKGGKVEVSFIMGLL